MYACALLAVYGGGARFGCAVPVCRCPYTAAAAELRVPLPLPVVRTFMNGLSLYDDKKLMCGVKVTRLLHSTKLAWRTTTERPTTLGGGAAVVGALRRLWTSTSASGLRRQGPWRKWIYQTRAWVRPTMGW